MQAIIQDGYGSPDEVLELRDIEEPTVGDDDVLVRVRAASVNPLDWHLVTGTPYIARLESGLRRPKRTTPGADVAGQVEAVGKNVTRFRPGDEVFGENSGTFAEYVCVPEDGVVAKPANLTFEQAAAVPVAGLTALQGLRDKGRIEEGDSVLIIGASGGVGTFAVQLAKSFGAEVTGFCSTRNIEMVRSIGADHVIDYTQEDVVGTGERYDVVLDAVGTLPISECKSLVGSDGTYVLVGGPKGRLLGPVPHLIAVLVASKFGGQRMVGILARQTTEDLLTLKRLLESGDVTPVIDRTYPLSEVPVAIMRQGRGHGRGKTVITV
ncbi:Bifunctional protein: zinc-containing alcohol dehydrogenase; quinone oxidoreductase (NADPH:quinone reductase); Similar to arginate lyase [hydrothermal vent metagenome]|uniref:Bifunctional protein: zinc-containing alcohol dehydrogenase quinone oxidoreductase ( NADPH:quinone reductase) Similar to arginate lyase n=2 Tax=hydrothermal vent metagenome TaxID=652676 RepID=A0A3B0S970_9ZZZZ